MARKNGMAPKASIWLRSKSIHAAAGVVGIREARTKR